MAQTSVNYMYLRICQLYFNKTGRKSLKMEKKSSLWFSSYQRFSLKFLTKLWFIATELTALCSCAVVSTLILFQYFPCDRTLFSLCIYTNSRNSLGTEIFRLL